MEPLLTPAIFGLLILMSVLCWTIFVLKLAAWWQVSRLDRQFLAAFRAGERLGAPGPSGTVWSQALAQGRSRLPHVDSAHLADVLYRVAEQQVQALERQIAVLGSLGATAPFVGLLGTVLGIITTLHDMGQQGHVTIATIAPGISDALVSTALGLAVAIPAVLMYNGFRRRAERLRDDLEAFRLEALYVLMDQLKHEGAT